MATKPKANHLNPYHAVAIIVGFVLLLAALFITVQARFSHKLKSIVITSSNGTVSPEYQQSQTLLITKDSCTITTTKGTEKNPVVTNCQSSASNFSDIQKSFNEYNVLEKINSTSSQTPKLLGGSTLTVTATLQNGDSYSSKGNPAIQSDIQPFLDQISVSYPAVGKF